MSGTVFAPGETVGAAELTRAGLLLLGEKVAIDATTVLIPVDAEGTVRRIEIGSGVRVGAYALICGGACIGENAHVEEHTIVGKPEKGYAVGQFYPGTGAHTQIGPGVVLQPDRELLGLCAPLGVRRPNDTGGPCSASAPDSACSLALRSRS